MRTRAPAKAMLTANIQQNFEAFVGKNKILFLLLTVNNVLLLPLQSGYETSDE